MCCQAHISTNQADSGGKPLAGIGVKIGAGTILHNATVIGTSPTVTVPYGHFTAADLGNCFGGQTDFVNSACIIAVNSFTSVTLSNPATGSGTNVELAGNDFVNAATTSLYIDSLTSNNSGPGLPNIQILPSVQELTVNGIYMEQGEASFPTDEIYIAKGAASLSFNRVMATGASGGAADYAIDSFTAGGWCVYGYSSTAGILDNGFLVPQDKFNNGNYCHGGAPFLGNPANLASDSDFKQGSTYWTMPVGGSVTGGVGPLGDNGVTIPLSGTATGSLWMYQTAALPNPVNGKPYTVGVAVNASTVTAVTGGGGVYIDLCSGIPTSSCAGYGASGSSQNSSITVGLPGWQYLTATFDPATWTGGPYISIGINQVKGTGNLVISEPYIVQGVIPGYMENDCGSGSGATGSSGCGGGNISGGVLGSVPYQSAPNTTAVTAANTSASTLCFTETGTGTVGAVPVWGSCAGSAATAFSAITGSTNTSAAMIVGTGASLSVSGSGTIAATSAVNMTGGALGSAPYQSAANTSAFIASPTTSGHTFVYAWQPSGSTIAPAAFDITNYLTAGTVTSVGFTGGLISVATPTSTPAFSVAGTSGGMPYFASPSTWASSALLATNALMVGGGAGGAPTTGNGDFTYATHTLTGGSSALLTLAAANAVTLSAMTGTSCLEEVSGVVTATGSVCGSGGSL